MNAYILTTDMDAVEEVKARLNIEDVIGEYVQLKRAGRNFKGLSPFGAEKSPSFMVSPEKGIWHDFSSGKGGNMFSFIMEMEGLEFRQALELLARKAGVDLEQFRGKSGGSQAKERLYAANEQACKFYQVQFSKNHVALAYVFTQRQFSKQTALTFRLGYAPNTGRALIDYLQKQGFTEQELIRAGLTARRYQGGIQDMFRGRLVVPLMDQQGRVIGFTARILHDEPNAPKYLNTPQTVLYDKSRHVYGLSQAKDALRRQQRAVLVEGNLDVIASHQAGVEYVVATAGTALTEMHLKTISRFTGDIRLAFDQDKAGLAATERAIPIASKVGVRLNIISIPAGKDPDELIKKDPALWQQAIDNYEYAVDWVIRTHQQSLDIEKATDKRTFSDVVLAIIRQLPDAVEQDHYVQKIAQILEVNPDAIASKLRETPASRPTIKHRDITPAMLDQALLERKRPQDKILALLLMRPGLRHHARSLQGQYLPEQSAQALLAYLQDNPDFDGKLVATELKKNAEYIKIVSLQYETLYQDLDDQTLEQELKRQRDSLIKQYVKIEKAKLATALYDADAQTREDLQSQDKALNQLLKEVM